MRFIYRISNFNTPGKWSLLLKVKLLIPKWFVLIEMCNIIAAYKHTVAVYFWDNIPVECSNCSFILKFNLWDTWNIVSNSNPATANSKVKWFLRTFCHFELNFCRYMTEATHCLQWFHFDSILLPSVLRFQLLERLSNFLWKT